MYVQYCNKCELFINKKNVLIKTKHQNCTGCRCPSVKYHKHHIFHEDRDEEHILDPPLSIEEALNKIVHIAYTKFKRSKLK